MGNQLFQKDDIVFFINDGKLFNGKIYHIGENRCLMHVIGHVGVVASRSFHDVVLFKRLSWSS